MDIDNCILNSLIKKYSFIIEILYYLILIDISMLACHRHISIFEVSQLICP